MSHNTLPGSGVLAGLYLLLFLMLDNSRDVQAKDLNQGPKIVYPENGTIVTVKDSSCQIQCRAESRWPKFHIIYWLTNNSFIEDVYPDGRVTEQPDNQTNSEAFCTVEKTLLFSHTQQGDFSRQFTCVIQDPSGVDFKHFTLKQLEPENRTSTQPPRSSRTPAEP